MAKKCDRCGRSYRPKGVSIKGINTRRIGLLTAKSDSVPYIELCPGCLRSLRSWLNKGDIVAQLLACYERLGVPEWFVEADFFEFGGATYSWLPTEELYCWDKEAEKWVRSYAFDVILDHPEKIKRCEEEVSKWS